MAKRASASSGPEPVVVDIPGWNDPPPEEPAVEAAAPEVAPPAEEPKAEPAPTPTPEPTQAAPAAPPVEYDEPEVVLPPVESPAELARAKRLEELEAKLAKYEQASQEESLQRQQQGLESKRADIARQMSAALADQDIGKHHQLLMARDEVIDQLYELRFRARPAAPAPAPAPQAPLDKAQAEVAYFQNFAATNRVTFQEQQKMQARLHELAARDPGILSQPQQAVLTTLLRDVRRVPRTAPRAPQVEGTGHSAPQASRSSAADKYGKEAVAFAARQLGMSYADYLKMMG